MLVKIKMEVVMIKKQFEEIHKFLVEHKDKKVESILPMLTQLMCAKNQERTYVVDENGMVITIYCYYHKRWELIDKIEYGKKASTATGYNTMCKEGVRQWTKQQNEAKRRKEILLAKVATGQISSEQLNEALQQIESERNKIEPLPKELDRYNYETKEEALKAYTKFTNKKLNEALQQTEAEEDKIEPLPKEEALKAPTKSTNKK